MHRLDTMALVGENRKTALEGFTMHEVTNHENGADDRLICSMIGR